MNNNNKKSAVCTWHGQCSSLEIYDIMVKHAVSLTIFNPPQQKICFHSFLYGVCEQYNYNHSHLCGLLDFLHCPAVAVCFFRRHRRRLLLFVCGDCEHNHVHRTSYIQKVIWPYSGPSFWRQILNITISNEFCVVVGFFFFFFIIILFTRCVCVCCL